MNDTDVSYFRGYWSIREVIEERMNPLAEWLKENRPSCRVMTLRGKDYDLVRRWPKASGLLGITVTKDATTFKGFELHRDKAPARYEMARL